MNRWLRGDRACLLIAALTPILIYADVAAGAALFVGDSYLQEFPFRYFLGKSLAHGHFPVWAPQLNFGHDFLGEFFATAFYPPNYLFSFAAYSGGLQLWQWDTLLHMSLGAVLYYRFLRSAHCSPAAALFGAVCFASSALAMAHSGHNSYSRSLAWSGAVLHAARNLALGARRRDAAFLSMAMCLVWTAGSPPVTWMLGIAASLYLVALLLSADRWRNFFAPANLLPNAGIVLPLFVLPAAPQFLVSYPHALEAARSHWDDAMRFGFHSKARSFLHLLYGRWFEYWPDPGHWEFNAHIGLFPLTLALIAFWRGLRHDVEIRFWLLLAMAGALLANGDNLIYRTLYDHAPGFSFLRAPGRFVYWILLALCFAAARGLDGIAAQQSSSPRPWFWPAVFFGALLLYMLPPFYKNSDRMPLDLAAALRFAPDFLAFVLAVGLLVVWRRSTHWTAGGKGLLLALSLFTIVGWNVYFHRLVERPESLPDPQAWCRPGDVRCAAPDEAAAQNDNWALLGDRLLGSGSLTLETERQAQFKQALYSAPNPANLRFAAAFDGAPVAWIQGAFQSTPTPPLDLMLQSDFQACRLWIERDSPLPSSRQSSANPTNRSCIPVAPVAQQNPNRLRFLLPASGGNTATYLYVSRTWSPRTAAFVDGRPVEVHRANYLFLAVPLPAGAREVEIVQRLPFSFPKPGGER